jgi:hypothetical protein
MHGQKNIKIFTNNVDDHLEFKLPEEANNTMQYLEGSIRRNDNNTELDIYRKPTYVDIMIRYTYNHPYDHKLAAFIFCINRMITKPITYQAISRKWHKILIMAQNNDFPKCIIHELKKKLTTKRHESHKYTPRNNKRIDGLLLCSTAPL